MRKLMMLTSLLMFVFLLYGCNKSTPVITLSPKEVTIGVYQPYDLMTGVTAKDKNNRDITDSIVVDDEAFNNVFEGTYQVKYQVEDKNGKKAVATRTIIVTDLIDLQPTPQVTQKENIVVSYNDFKVTKGELYHNLKKYNGFSIFIEMIDNHLFSSYRDRVTDEFLEENYNSLIAEYGEVKLLDILAQLGYYKKTNETEAEFHSRVLAYFENSYLLREVAKAELEASITNEEITTAQTNYREDLCVIDLSFNTKAEADSFVSSLQNKTDEEKLQAFKSKFVKKTLADETSYLATQITCDYNRIRYNDFNDVTLRTYIFDALTVGSFNITPKIFNNKYYVFYIANKANLKETYDTTLFHQNLKQDIVAKKLTNEYITTTINRLRDESGLKIYDPYLANLYEEKDANFNGVSPLIDEYKVASIGDFVITADDLYVELKNKTGALSLLDDFDFLALSSINSIKLTSTDWETVDSRVEEVKDEFVSRGLSEHNVSFSEYLNYYYKVNTIEEFRNKIATIDLSDRYILGYNLAGDQVFAGVDPVNQESINDEIDKYFNVQASHILFAFSKNDAAAKSIARLKADQVVRGVAEGETAYILLDGASFNGLDSQLPVNYQLVFGKLAKAYSDDTGSGQNYGDLGYFTSGKMVKPFEEGVRQLISEGINSYTIVESQFGYHVILLTGIKPNPAKPDNYDNLTQKEIDKIIFEGQNAPVIEYSKFLDLMKNNATKTLLSDENVNYHLSALRKTQNITINDEELKYHYDLLNNIYTR